MNKVKKYLKFIGITLSFVFINALVLGIRNTSGGPEKLSELGLIFGVIVGLIIAVVITIYIMKSWNKK